MGLGKLSYGHTLMQQVRGHCRDSQAQAITPFALAAFIYPPWLLVKTLFTPLFLTWSQEGRARHFVILVGSLMIQSRNTREETPQ